MSRRDPSGQFTAAARFSVRAQARNRMAALLLVAFVPAWYAVMVAIVPHTTLEFRLRSTSSVLHVDGRDLSLITAGLNAITLIVGFAVFSATRRALTFDRRLVLAGYRRPALLAGKCVAISVTAVCVAAYTALVMLAYWRPAALASIGGAYALAAGEYGALGLLLGVLVRGDLEGFFLIIMTGLMDTFLQNPVGNPVANSPVLEWFPTYGPTQLAAGAAFDHRFLLGNAGLALAWIAGLSAAATLVFWLRTRTPHVTAAQPLPLPSAVG